MFYKKQKLLTHHKHLGFRFVVGFELLIVLVICVVVCFYVLSVFVLCFMCPMLPVFLDCPFLIALSVFSNGYSTKYMMTRISKEFCVCGNYFINQVESVY